MTAWPASLPQDSLRDGYREEPLDTAIRSGMSYGPDKVRRRTTTVIRRVSIPMRMTTAQVSDLETFYYDTIQVTGVVDWINHRTRAAAQYRFLGPPQYQPYGAGYWAVLLEMEILP